MVFGLLFLLSGLTAQARIGDWESYTSPLHVTALAEHDGKIWCATRGGLLIFDLESEQFTTLTNLDGLQGTDLATLTLDQMGGLWLGGGSPNGFVQIYDPEQYTSQAIFDYDLSEVRVIVISDSIAYGAYRQNQDWGLIEFILAGEKFIYRDVYRNWPVNLAEITGLALSSDRLYVATDRGLLVAEWRVDNLKDPASWDQPFPDLNGAITTLRQFGNTVLLVQDNRVYQLDLVTGALPQMVWDYFANSSSDIIDVLITSNGSRYGIQKKRLFEMGDSALEWQLQPGYEFTCLLELTDGRLLAGTTNGLVFVEPDGSSYQRLIPNAPLANHFTAVTVLADGRLVAGAENGLAIKEEAGWRNIISTTTDTVIVHDRFDYTRFAADTIPVDFGRGGGNYLADLEQGPDGLLYGAVRGTYPRPRKNGGGVFIIDVDNPAEYVLIDTSVLDYFADQYLVVKDVMFDRFGNLWVADTYATTRLEPIHVRNPEGQWYSYRTDTTVPLSLGPNSLAMDRWGRLWIASEKLGENIAPAVNGGLMMLDMDGDYFDPDNINVYIAERDLDVWSVAVTGNDVLYMLTPLGLRSMILKSSSDNPVQKKDFPYFPNISFGVGSKIRLDVRDNIWTTSPSQGVHILLENTTYWPTIEGLRQNNSYLLSDEVTDLAFDRNRGIAYITTSRGISVLKIPFATGYNSYEYVRIFPSPFHIPTTRPLVIEGLIDNSEIKIMKLNGQVVRDISSLVQGVPGYQAFWDGRDNAGRWVGSGVYLISVYTPQGDVEIFKTTVIRH
jgi:ligand-binding sensor domain-containing protein